ncbi:MAG: GFA family protein [Pseudomonadota bacterium]
MVQQRVNEMGHFQAIKGRCECGAVRYTVNATAQELYHCHCSRCRHLHGSLFATYAYVLREDIEITGEGNLSTYRSPLADWHFCKTCGCHLFAEHDHNPGVMWYMPATLERDAHPQHPEETEKHIFVASRSPLETLQGDLPQYDEYAPPDVSVTARKSQS